MFDQLRIFIEKFDCMDWSGQRDMTNSLTFSGMNKSWH